MHGTRTLVITIALLGMLVTSGWAATLEVTQPVQVTSDSYYERGQSIVYDGSDYWLFYGRSATCTVPYSGGDPDLHDYVTYYKTASTVAGLAAASPASVTGAHNSDSYMGETGAVVYGSDVWVFAAIDGDGVYTPTADCDLYGWWSNDGGSVWNEVGPIVSAMGDGQAHHGEVVFDGKLWVLEGASNYTTMYSTTPKTGGWSTPVTVGSLTGGLGHFFVDGSSLYLALGSGGTYYIYIWNSGTSAWDLVDSKTISGYYDPTLYKVGSDYVFHCAPYTGGRQWIVGWTGTTLDGTFFDGTELDVVEGRYGSNVWVDMWPIGFTTGSMSYLFYTSERATPAAEGPGNIWYLEVDWTVSNDHYTYVQEAIDAAASGDAIDVSAGTYAEYLHITTDDLTVEGAGIDQSIVDLDGLMPYWHYDGCSTSYASRAGVLLSGYGSPDEIVEDVILRGFTVKNAGLNPPGGGSYTEYVDPDGDGQDDVRGIGIHNGKNILIESCKVQYSGYNGFGAGKARCTTLRQSENVTIKDCVASDNCNTGIVIGDHVGFVTITGNVCTNNKMPWTWSDPTREYAGKGIEVVGGSGAKVITGLISGNTCTANGYQGITLKNYSNGVVVENNTITGHNLDEDGAGIFFYAKSSTPANCVNDTIRNNALSGNIRGIVGYYAQDALIEDNTISTASGTFDPGQEGIKLDGCNGCLVTGNTLTDCDGTGIKAQNTWDSVECYSNTVTGNTITNANGAGIRASSGSHNNTFDENTVNGAKFAGIFVYLGAYDNTFTDNLVTGVTTQTLYPGEDYEVTQGDGIFLWGYNGDFDARAGTGNTFSGNGVYGNAGDGIENQVDSMTVDASGNWWGSAVAATVATAVGSYVDYTPWLTGGTALNPGYAGDYSTLHVDDDSPQTGTSNRIQEGVDLVSGSTLHVANGTYNATTSNSAEWSGHPGEWWFVTVDKSLDIIGESRDGVVLDGTALQTENRCTGIWVSASNVAVKNLTLQGFTQSPVTAACYAMYVMEEFRNYTWADVDVLEYVTAENLRFSGNMYAPYFMKTEHATVRDCISENNLGDGVWVAWGSHYATVEGNTVTNAGDHGIWVGSTWMGPPGSDNVTITDNTVNGAREGGISFVGSDGATIEGNTITNVAAEGWSVGALSLKDGPSNVTARYNIIHGNDGTWGGYAGTGHGIGIDGTPSNITLNWNSVYGNAGDGCNNSSTVNVDATYNWWGDASGPGGVGPGSGDEVSTYVLYDPWIGKAGSENIVCDPDPAYLTVAVPTKTIAVKYLGGGSGLLAGYSVKFSWDAGVASTTLGDVNEGTLLSSAGSTQFMKYVSGTNEITVDCALLSGVEGVSGPGTMFTIDFDAVAYGTSAVDVTLISFRDKDNNPLSGFYEDDGEIQVDITDPSVTGVGIENLTLTHTDEFAKNTDNLELTATVTDDYALTRFDIVADLSGLLSSGGTAVVAESYASNVATWTTALANVALTADGLKTVTVTATDGLGNSASDTDEITVDNTAPAEVTGVVAAPGHNKVALTWVDAVGGDANPYQVEIQSNAWADYPTYDATTPVYPDGPTAGDDVWEGTGASYTVTYLGDASERSIYYFSVIASDMALNYSSVDSDGQDRATNYWLGDVVDHAGGLPPNGFVHDYDIVALSGTYGLATGPPPFDDECDVGPTDDHSRVGIPGPDDMVNFEDLMIFAMNYGVVAPRIVPFLVEPGVGDLALALVENGRTSNGVLELALRLEGNAGDVKGLTAELEFEGLEFLSARLSDEMSSPLADMFFWSNATRRSVQVDAAVLGTDVTIGGSGDVVLLTFQVLDETYSVDFASAQLRGAANEDLTAELEGLSSDGVPVAFKLVQNSPNPFNPVTKVAYHMPSASRVTIRVFDVTGRLVTTLVDGVVEAGRHAVVWNGTNDRGESVGSGVYFCTMETPDFRDSHKMTLLK